ncbi:hypothetical protein [Spirosoma aerolatum]|nr:hypothetical protein [Spirosoma aerolatum]
MEQHDAPKPNSLALIKTDALGALSKQYVDTDLDRELDIIHQ